MESMTPSFDYDEFTTRNIGFVSAEEQAVLRRACAFVPGVGGMGGAAVLALARAGVGRFVIADMDRFEVSNLNRQVFATLETTGMEKTEATRRGVAAINPQADVEIRDGSWVENIAGLVGGADIVINGTDDVAATVRLYRAARDAGRTVIDAYAAALPSVYVTRAGDPTPEDRLGYPTRGRSPDEWSDDDLGAVFLRELEYVMGLSSSRKYIDLAIAAEVAAGRRSRMSFAPMVMTTGNMMAYEAVNGILGKPHGADYRGYFFNPYTGRTERPPPGPVAFIMRRVARRAIARLMSDPS